MKQNSHLFSRQVSHDPNHVFLNLRHDSLQTEEDWCEWWTKMAANLKVFKRRYKKIAFYPNRKFFSQKFIK